MLPEVDAVLRGGGRVADVGCGLGWSSIGIAGGCPAVRVDGFDVDAPSLEQAQRNALAAGVADRVTFSLADAGERTGDGSYDLVTAFECVHDLADPVAVLAAMRTMVRPDGTVLVVDERVAETSTVVRPATPRGYARQTGFADVEVLPVEHDFFRFYRLVPG
ncbi:class I SAM-dependent methyltransferase [Blastococcus sp. TML/C7B]|uniref:class I SAM-dependent methyltransferase n=1 Tax=Blastococcus sp. TML/C7B TaxID=2798728 RepID=UPI00190A1DE0|nr:class I SAM-dependent methyltransferase [Blastococcus sp. TML/C7B]MBN1095364.1 class I SAM-dependent methyltransferase [Blastococcus sp. TML/C7B]